MSDVIAHGRKDQVWVTIQIHPNIVAVAVLKELAAIVVANGREPAAETVDRARKEQVPILGTTLTAFEIAGRLHGLGIRGDELMALRRFRADLHIHTCLSPCGELDDLPPPDRRAGPRGRDWTLSP